MEWFFRNEDNKKILENAIQNWIGVPYEHMGESKSGVDCSKLLALILKEMDILKDTIKGLYRAPDWPYQSRQEFLLNAVEETLKKHLDRRFIFRKFKTSPLQYGDFIFLSIFKSKVCNHSGIYLGEDKIFHCLTRKQCCITQLNFALKKKIVLSYRLFEV